MHLGPARLVARVANDDDSAAPTPLAMMKRGGENLNARQFGGPIDSFLSSLFGDEPETTTTTRRGGTTTTRTLITPTPTPIVISVPPVNTLTNTRTTSSTRLPTTSSTPPLATASLATSQPPILAPSPSQQTTTVFSTSSGSSDQANQTDGSNTSNGGGLPSVVVGIIVAASVIFGLIIIALIARKIFQARRRARRTTWRTSGITPFAPGIQEEKALPPPPPMDQQEYPNNSSGGYPAYPPQAAVTFANPYGNTNPSPAMPSAGYSAPYPFSGPGAVATPPSMMQNTITAGAFASASAYTPADPVVIPPTPITPMAPAAGVGQISVVKRMFIPSLPDELSIATGDKVRILSAYDDGWALCEKVATGDKGVVPQECLDMTSQADEVAASVEGSQLSRGSSLRRPGGQQQ